MGEKLFGQHVADIRKRVGMTQTQLAERMGISQALVSKIENAKTVEEAAPEKTLRGLARTLDVSFEDLVRRVGGG